MIFFLSFETSYATAVVQLCFYYRREVELHSVKMLTGSGWWVLLKCNENSLSLFKPLLHRHKSKEMILSFLTALTLVCYKKRLEI